MAIRIPLKTDELSKHFHEFAFNNHFYYNYNETYEVCNSCNYTTFFIIISWGDLIT